MTEPDVALTDYFLAAEAALFFVLLQRGKPGNGKLRVWFALFFASVSVAALCGGTVHGYSLDHRTTGNAVLWTTTLLAMGVAALSAWVLGALLLFSPRTANWILLAAVMQWALYAIAILRGNQPFWIALADTLPAMLFLMTALGVVALREKHWSLIVASGGLAFTFLAGALQQLRIGVHPHYFNHNALAHVVQSVAILLLFLGADHLVRTGTCCHANTT